MTRLALGSGRVCDEGMGRPLETLQNPTTQLTFILTRPYHLATVADCTESVPARSQSHLKATRRMQDCSAGGRPWTGARGRPSIGHFLIRQSFRVFSLAPLPLPRAVPQRFSQYVPHIYLQVMAHNADELFGVFCKRMCSPPELVQLIYHFGVGAGSYLSPAHAGTVAAGARLAAPTTWPMAFP